MRNASTYLKMRVLGAIEFAEGNSIAARIRKVSEQTFTDDDGLARKFTWRTISTWLYRYKVHGVTSMAPAARRDKGLARKVSPEQVLEAVKAVLPSFRCAQPNMAQLYRACIERGLLRRERVAPNTFRRLVALHQMLTPDEQATERRRLAFSKQYANQMWQADTMVGPYVRSGGANVQSRLICFIDDASRLVCHGEFFAAENTDTLVRALRSALYKRGVPDQLYVDNGSIYCSREITAICARIGCLLSHAPVHDGAAKGKIERFFRTVRDQFLSRQLDLGSVEALNRQFTRWVEEDYNSRPHATLGMRPVDRFGLDLRRIRFLPPCQANDELFYAEDNRRVRTDNTFSFRGARHEAPCDLRMRTIQVRFCRSAGADPVVYFKGQRMGIASRVDFVANDRHPATEDRP